MYMHFIYSPSNGYNLLNARSGSLVYLVLYKEYRSFTSKPVKSILSSISMLKMEKCRVTITDSKKREVELNGAEAKVGLSVLPPQTLQVSTA